MDEGADEMAHEMAHEDIWDDSALVNSWNEALAEYKKYHSIHAAGGRLEDLAEHAKPETSRRHHAEPAPRLTGEGEGEATAADPADQEIAATGTVTGTVTGADAGTDGVAKDRIDEGENVVMNGDVHGEGQGATSAIGGAGLMPPPPQALLGSVQDQGLKRLLMSWYWAGYYTGLYEGQQGRQDQHQRGAP